MDILLQQLVTPFLNLLQIIFLSLVLYATISGGATFKTKFFYILTFSILIFYLGRFVMIHSMVDATIVIGYKMAVLGVLFSLPLWSLFVLELFEDYRINVFYSFILLLPSTILAILLIDIDLVYIVSSKIGFFSSFDSMPIYRAFFVIFLLTLSTFVFLKILHRIVIKKNKITYYTLLNLSFSLSFIFLILLENFTSFKVTYSLFELFSMFMFFAYMVRFRNDLNFSKSYKIESIVIKNLSQPFLLLNENKKIISCNSSAKAIFNNSNYLVNKQLLITEIPIFKDLDIDNIGNSDFKSFDIKFLSSGSEVFFNAHVSKVKVGSQLVGYGIVLNNTTNFVNLIDKFKTLSETDSLTKFLTRSAFFDLAQPSIEGCSNFVVAMLDLDNFKNINDTYSHMAGDYTLVTFTKLVSSILQDHCILGRYGGEEFCILSTNKSDEDIITFATMLNKVIREHEFVFEDHKFKLTVSIGICQVKNNKISVEEALRLADNSLYKVKNFGKDSYNIVTIE